MDPILKVESLFKSFGKKVAVDGLSFGVSQGQIFGILGPNGSGKTTTLAVILGVIKPNSGAYCWFGGIDGAIANRRIGSLIEVPYFYPYLTLKKNLELVALSRGRGDKDIPRVLDEVGLASRTTSQYSTLSLGMKQRLALASALVGDPEVLVLDEPTNGLDPEGIAEVRELLRSQARRGKTVIMASHILDEVEKVCSHVIFLKNGKCISEGKVEALIAQKNQVIVESDDISLLAAILTTNDKCNIIGKDANSVTLSIRSDYSLAELNTWLVGQGIPLTRFEPRRRTLESQFLDLVRNKDMDDRQT